MKIYALYHPPDVLKYRLIIHDDDHLEWDFSRDELGALWLSEEDRAEIVKAIEYFELHAPHEPGFMTKGYTVRRVPSP
jgi:hypothetical protein